MRIRCLILCSAAIVAVRAEAGMIYTPFDGGGVASDAKAAGASCPALVSGYEPPIKDVVVKLNLPGGSGGDLCACLSSGGLLVPVVISAGPAELGYVGKGFDVTQTRSDSEELDVAPLPEPANIAL